MSFVDSTVDALRFLTRLPLPARAGSRERVRFGAAAFPLVGALLGGLALVMDRAAAGVPESLRNVAILVLWALATGAIHYDGLADSLDALGGTNREERLRIMRDGAVGSFAVLGLALTIAAELQALALLHDFRRTQALLCVPVVGRWAMVLAAFRARPARAGGLGAAFVEEVSLQRVVVASATTAIWLVACAGDLVALVPAAVAAASVRRLARAAFGGVTGDVLGACGKVGEVFALAWLAST